MTQINWRSLNATINELTEQQVLDLLTAERTGERRIAILQRLHQRYAALRTARERVELLQEALKP